MKLDDILKEDSNVFNKHILSENKSFITKTLNDLSKYTWDRLIKKLKFESSKFMKLIDKEGYEDDILKILNKNGFKINSLKSFSKRKLIESTESINKGFSDWWQEAKGNLYGALSFLPILNVFMEIDKLIKGNDYSSKAIIIYFVLWASILTGKIVNDKIKKSPILGGSI